MAGNPQSERDIDVTVMEYILSPQIPPEEKANFERLYVAFTNTMALGNIEREDLFSLQLMLKEAIVEMNIGLYDLAYEVLAEMIAFVQWSRSVGGFQTLFGQQGIQRSEHIERVIARTSKKGLLGKLGSAFKKEKMEPLDMNEASAGRRE